MVVVGGEGPRPEEMTTGEGRGRGRKGETGLGSDPGCVGGCSSGVGGGGISGGGSGGGGSGSGGGANGAWVRTEFAPVGLADRVFEHLADLEDYLTAVHSPLLERLLGAQRRKLDALIVGL